MKRKIGYGEKEVNANEETSDKRNKMVIDTMCLVVKRPRKLIMLAFYSFFFFPFLAGDQVTVLNELSKPVHNTLTDVQLFEQIYTLTTVY